MPEISGNLIGIGLVIFVLGIVLGWLTGHLRNARRVSELETRLDIEKQSADEKISDLETRFSQISSEALRANNQSFLQLAEETLKRLHAETRGKLDQKEKAVENLVKPKVVEF